MLDNQVVHSIQAPDTALQHALGSKYPKVGAFSKEGVMFALFGNNTLYVSGDAEEVKKFLDEIEEGLLKWITINKLDDVDSKMISRCGVYMNDAAYLKHCESKACISCVVPPPTTKTKTCSVCGKSVAFKDHRTLSPQCFSKIPDRPTDGSAEDTKAETSPSALIKQFEDAPPGSDESKWRSLLDKYSTLEFEAARPQFEKIMESWTPTQLLDLLQISSFHDNTKFRFVCEADLKMLLNLIKSEKNAKKKNPADEKGKLKAYKKTKWNVKKDAPKTRAPTLNQQVGGSDATSANSNNSPHSGSDVVGNPTAKEMENVAPLLPSTSVPTIIPTTTTTAASSTSTSGGTSSSAGGQVIPVLMADEETGDTYPIFKEVNDRKHEINLFGDTVINADIRGLCFFIIRELARHRPPSKESKGPKPRSDAHNNLNGSVRTVVTPSLSVIQTVVTLPIIQTVTLSVFLSEALSAAHKQIKETGSSSDRWSSQLSSSRREVDLKLREQLVNSKPHLCITCHHPFTKSKDPKLDPKLPPKREIRKSHIVSKWYIEWLDLGSTMNNHTVPKKHSDTEVPPTGTQSPNSMTYSLQCEFCEVLQSSVEKIHNDYCAKFMDVTKTLARTRLMPGDNIGCCMDDDVLNSDFPGVDLPHYELYNFVVTTLFRLTVEQFVLLTFKGDGLTMWDLMDRLRLELNYHLLQNPNGEFPEPGADNPLYIYCIPEGGKMFFDMRSYLLKTLKVDASVDEPSPWMRTPTSVVASVKPFIFIGSSIMVREFEMFRLTRDKDTMVKLNLATKLTPMLRDVFEKSALCSIDCANGAILKLLNPKSSLTEANGLMSRKEYNQAVECFEVAFPPANQTYLMYCLWLSINFRHTVKDENTYVRRCLRLPDTIWVKRSLELIGFDHMETFTRLLITEWVGMLKEPTFLKDLQASAHTTLIPGRFTSHMFRLESAWEYTVSNNGSKDISEEAISKVLRDMGYKYPFDL